MTLSEPLAFSPNAIAKTHSPVRVAATHRAVIKPHLVRTVISFSPCVEIVRARAIWEEVVKGIAPSATALMKRIDDLCDPERIEAPTCLKKCARSTEMRLR